MPRRYNIKWREDDQRELQRVVKNFNAKISRLEKNHPHMANALPERVTVKQMREMIATRQDLKRELNALQRFTRRGAEKLVELPNNEYNLKTTKWQRDEMSRRVGVINRKRKKRLEDIEGTQVKSRGKETGYTRGQLGMGKVDEVALKPMQAFTNKMSRKDLNKKFRSIMKESQSNYWSEKDRRLMDNYIKAITENYNPADIQDVVSAIRNMGFEKFYETFKAEEGTKIEHPYFPSQEEYEKSLNYLKSVWTPNKSNGSDL